MQLDLLLLADFQGIFLHQIACMPLKEATDFIQNCQAYRDSCGIEICDVTSSNVGNSNDVKSAVGIAMTPHLPSRVDNIYMHWQRAY